MTSVAAPTPGAWQDGTIPIAGPVPTVRHSSHRKVIGLLAMTVAVVVGVIVGVAAAIAPAHKHYVCPPDCGGPPTVKPVSANPRFVGPSGAYSVEYWPSGGAVSTTADHTGVTLQINAGDTTGTVRLFGADANGRTAQQVASTLVAQAFPNARRSYVIPNAFIGYQAGYGEVDDVAVQSSNGGAADDRLVVMVAIKNGIALVGEALGPYQPATPSEGSHASAVGLTVAGGVLDPLVNSFTWRGDPPR
ncbi:MAG TPA: hypothetical protein VIG48_08250 [Jatrophihabitans sp.]|jgi:hypothetical protein